MQTCDNRFDKKVALITGGASGIGAATARRLHSEGISVVLTDINTDAGNALAKELGEDTAEFIQADVSNYEEIQAVAESTFKRFGRIDVLFNNAGIGCHGETPDLDIEQWRKVLAVDLDAVFYGCKAVIPIMRKQGSGAIINNASVSGLGGDYGLAAYNAAKGGVVNYTRAAAVDHAKDNIRINAICPGAIDTQIIAPIKDLPGGAQDVWNNCIPMKRFGQPDEIASVVAFLASDDASYMTGAIVNVDGGITAHSGQPNLAEVVARARES